MCFKKIILVVFQYLSSYITSLYVMFIRNISHILKLIWTLFGHMAEPKQLDQFFWWWCNINWNVQIFKIFQFGEWDATAASIWNIGPRFRLFLTDLSYNGYVLDIHIQYTIIQYILCWIGIILDSLSPLHLCLHIFDMYIYFWADEYYLRILIHLNVFCIRFRQK